MSGAGEALNLRGISVMLLQGSDTEMAILAGIVGALGCWSPVRCASAREAKLVLTQREIDMIVVDSELPDMDGYAFTQDLRRTGGKVNRAAPVILLAGHTRLGDVHRARDCGANLVVAKPVTPRILYERIAWLARDVRPFIDCEAYCGPDRRFQRLGPPPGEKGRRKDDLSAELGEAVAPNLSQFEIDTLFNPQRASV